MQVENTKELIMAKTKLGSSKNDTAFGRDLIAAAREALAHKSGKIVLSTHIVEPVERPSTK